jgi:hypothetical protein
MFEDNVVYVCLDCMQVGADSQFSESCRVVGINIGEVGSPERLPISDESGRLTTQAPRWFYELFESLVRAGNGFYVAPVNASATEA